MELRYAQSAWDLCSRLRMVGRQNVDDNSATGSGLDIDQSPAYAVLDMSGCYVLGKQVDVKYGVDNVFDRTYAEHQNKSNDFDPHAGADQRAG